MQRRSSSCRISLTASTPTRRRSACLAGCRWTHWIATCGAISRACDGVLCLGAPLVRRVEHGPTWLGLYALLYALFGRRACPSEPRRGDSCRGSPGREKFRTAEHGRPCSRAPALRSFVLAGACVAAWPLGRADGCGRGTLRRLRSDPPCWPWAWHSAAFLSGIVAFVLAAGASLLICSRVFSPASIHHIDTVSADGGAHAPLRLLHFLGSNRTLVSRLA